MSRSRIVTVNGSTPSLRVAPLQVEDDRCERSRCLKETKLHLAEIVVGLERRL
jgi:hypothetical protein